MIQNQSVRHRLRNELNVQLTDSNVIETNSQIIMESRIHQNDNQSVSDMSIIHELGMLDNFQQPQWKNDSNDYISRNHSVLNDNFDNYAHDQRYFHEKINSPLGLKNKIKSYRQELDVQNQYRSVHREFQTRVRATQVKTPPRNFVHIQSSKNILKSGREHNQIADIESKISILPYQLQQRIKENLHKKITALSRQENKQPSPIKQSEIFLPQFHKFGSEEQIYIQNGSIFLPPLEQKDTYGNYMNRQKFISVNREPLNSPKNVNMSIVVKDPSLLKHHKSISSHTNVNQNLHRRQKSTSRQNMIWNSIQLKQSPSSLLKNHSKSKDRQQSMRKNNNTNNVKKTAEIIERRKSEFEQFYNNQSSTNKVQEKQFNLKENMFEISEQFNKSKVIKFYTEILNSLPKCKKCSNSFGALTLLNNSVTFACNQCDLKNKEQRSVSFLSASSGDDPFLGLRWNIEKESPHYNHPIIGALFDIENKLTNETEMKTYNNLIKQITLELQKLQETKKKLSKLHTTVEQLKNKVRINPKCIFEAKNGLKKIFAPQFTPNNSPTNFQEQDKLRSIDKLLPSSYLQELDLWCKVKAQNFSQWSLIDEKLEILCPLYMKKNIKTIREFLDPLLHNFENNDIKISVSEGLKLPVKSLGSATFIVDGSYNISAFDHIQRLSMEFLNKRTFRQITSMMQNLPQTVEQLKVSYNHKLNSHISAQKYPILTKLCSIRSTKKLHATILNCKDEDDLISAMKVMTKKKELSITTTRSIYVRKPVTQSTNEIKQMIKRLGKNIYRCGLSLAVAFSEHEIYRELMLTERNKLMHFSLTSTLVNEGQSEFRRDKNEQENVMGGFSVISGFSQIDLSMLNESELFQNLPKECFSRKIRKKLSVLAVLKDSFKEKELIQKYKNEKAINIENLTRKHEMNHTLRLQVLKMLL